MGMGLPPELMSMIDQASQGGPDTPGPVGSAGPAGAEQPPTGKTPVEALRDILAAIEEYQAVETDDVDLSEAAKVYATVQKLLATNQQQQEAAAGVTPVHKGLAKAQAAAGPGYGP